MGRLLARMVMQILTTTLTGHNGGREKENKKTRPDTRHKMRLVYVLFTFENNTGHTDRRTDGRTDGRTQPHIEMRRRV